jgi:small neutral amino acid transporter SnatA (MarC family)
MTSAHALGHFLRTLPDSAIATFLALFPIVDPFGGVPVFFTMTSSWTARDRSRTAFKTGMWVFIILVTFLFFGRFVLHFFGISLPVIKIAGGLIVANTAWGHGYVDRAHHAGRNPRSREQRGHLSDPAGHAVECRGRAQSASSWLWQRMSTTPRRISGW